MRHRRCSVRRLVVQTVLALHATSADFSSRPGKAWQSYDGHRTPVFLLLSLSVSYHFLICFVIYIPFPPPTGLLLAV